MRPRTFVYSIIIAISRYIRKHSVDEFHIQHQPLGIRNGLEPVNLAPLQRLTTSGSRRPRTTTCGHNFLWYFGARIGGVQPVYLQAEEKINGPWHTSIEELT